MTRVALITGAGSGIGRASAIRLAADGFKQLVLVGRRAQKLQETADLISGAQCQCIAVDISSPQGRAELVGGFQHETLDVLVNNAGVFDQSPVGETPDSQWQAVCDLNLLAPFALIRDLLPQLKRAKLASVINISSTLADKPIPGTSAYNASKAGLIQMTRTLALELGPDHIRVNAVLPAVVETDMYRNRFDDPSELQEILASMAKAHPLGRVGQPEDIAAAVGFLASSDASWITGVALPVDGGMLCT